MNSASVTTNPTGWPLVVHPEDLKPGAKDATQQGDGELRLNNLTGHGILAVKGNLQLSGNLNWTGIILVTGIITSSGGGSNSKNILGQIYSGSSLLGDSAVTGSVTIGYDGCKVKQAIDGQPVKVRSWKQVY